MELRLSPDFTTIFTESPEPLGAAASGDAVVVVVVFAAPFPTADNQTQLYGSGVIGGDVIGIPRGAQHPQDAWLLLKYLATNTNAEEALAEKLRNVPTTYQSLKDPVLNQDSIFKVFLNIFANEKSGFKPLTPIGSADEDLWGTFLEKWEAGRAYDPPRISAMWCATARLRSAAAGPARAMPREMLGMTRE